MCARTVAGVLLGVGLLLSSLTPAVAYAADGATTATPTARSVARTAPAQDEGARPVGQRLARPLREDVVRPRAGGVNTWPGDTIRYWAKLPATFQWSLKAAADAWNRTGLDMTFKRVPKSRAQLKVTIGDTGGADGRATIGHQARNWVRLSPTLLDPISDASNAYVRVVAAHIIAHEFGHNLGLQHSGGCKLMTAILFLPDCPMMADEVGHYACRVVDPDSLDTAVDLYGGRRTLAPAACLVDKLPPVLSGVSFEGGLEAERPMLITWDPPGATPAGSRVRLLENLNGNCTFPVVRDDWGEAVYDENKVKVRSLDPAAGEWHQTHDHVADLCFGVQLANRSGAGRSPSVGELTSWVEAPDPPTVAAVRRAFDHEYFSDEYYVELDWSPAANDVAYLSAPTGQCVEEWPEGEYFQDHVAYGDPGDLIEIRATGPEPCLAFFAVREDYTRASDPVHWQVGEEPAPAAPQAVSVRRVPGTDTYEYDVTYQLGAAELAYLVRPEGQCPATWPAGEDPLDHLADYPLEAPGVTRPCLAFFTVNAFGEPSATGASWQVAASAVPPQPSITSVAHPPGSGYRVHASFDTSRWRLVSPGDVGCATTWSDAWGSPVDQQLYEAWDEPGVYDLYVEQPEPCLSFFLMNDDGQVGPGVAWQVPPAPTPPAPNVSNVSRDEFGYLTAVVSGLDLDVFGLALLERPQGQCADAIPPDEEPGSYAAVAYEDEETGKVLVDQYVEDPNACVTFFLYNADGEAGPGVQKQL